MAIINIRDGMTSTSSQDEVTIINNNVGALVLNDLSDVDTTGVADNKILKYDSTANKFVIADDTNTGLSNVVEDTTPELGGDLTLSGYKLLSDVNNFTWLTGSGDTGAMQTKLGGRINHYMNKNLVQFNNSSYDVDFQVKTNNNANTLFIEGSTDRVGIGTNTPSSLLDVNGTISTTTIDMGTNTITDAKVGQWDTAYSWGDHSTAGYLTTAYTDAEAISAVEGEATLDLTGQVTIDNGSEPLRITRSSDDNNGVIAFFKDVGSGGDMSRRFGSYHAITDGTTTKYLGVNNWSDDATNGKQYNIGWLTDDGATTNIVLQATENSGLVVSDDVDMQINDINEINSLTLNNAHGSSRDITIEAKDGGQGGLILTAKNSLSDNRRLDMIFRQTNNAGDTTHPIGSFDAVYDTTEADKRFQIRLFDNDGSSQANPHLELRHTGESVLRNETIRFREIDNTDMLTVKVNSGAVGGHDAQLYGQISIQPEGLSTETDLSLFQLRPDFGSNSVPDGAAVKLNFQVKNDADGIVSLGKLSANYDTTAADRNFRMESPSGDNSMRFYDSKTEFEGAPLRFTTLTTTEINALTAEAGMVVYNNTTNKLQCYNGTSWNDLF